MENLLKVVQYLATEQEQFLLRNDGECQSKLEISDYYEIVNTSDETLLLTRFDKRILETKNADTMIEVVGFTLKEIEREKAEYNKQIKEVTKPNEE